MRWLRRLAILLGVSSASAAFGADDGLHVTFVSPGRTGEVFWDDVARWMQAAADDVGINLEILRAERNHVRMVRILRSRVATEPPPDAVVVVNERLVAPMMIRAADHAAVPVMLLSNGLTQDQTDELGAPGELYKNWLGVLQPDHRLAGRRIAEALRERAVELGTCPRRADGKIGILAINGDAVTPASIGRRLGLLDALSAYDDLYLEQEVYGDWDFPRGYDAAVHLFDRYPRACLLWAANDPMALGALKAAKDAGRTPGSDVLIAGLNGSPGSIEAISEGEMVGSVAGHFTLGAGAMVMLDRWLVQKKPRSPGGVDSWPVWGTVGPENAAAYKHWYHRGWRDLAFDDLPVKLGPDGDAPFALDTFVELSPPP